MMSSKSNSVVIESPEKILNIKECSEHSDNKLVVVKSSASLKLENFSGK